jgi:glycosyltransferase involved in cell wall biosynthesis
MTDAPLVSVVIPVHNGERFFGRTLASAQAQTYTPLEIIVVDDGSIDATATLVKAAAAKDKRIRPFFNPKSGVASARNFGVKEAGGEFVALLDHDDLWDPKKIADQVKAMKAPVGLVYCWSVPIDEDDLVFAPPGIEPKHEGHVFDELATHCFIETSSSVLIRRSCFDKVGGYDPHIPQGAEDWKLYLTLSEICEFAVVPQYLVGYRQTPGSLSRSGNMARSIDAVIEWMTGKWPDLPAKIRRERTFHLNFYLAQLALDNGRPLEASRYWLHAVRLRPGLLLENSTFIFLPRLLLRTLRVKRGLPRQILKRYRCEFRSRLPFSEFRARFK